MICTIHYLTENMIALAKTREKAFEAFQDPVKRHETVLTANESVITRIGFQRILVHPIDMCTDKQIELYNAYILYNIM